MKEFIKLMEEYKTTKNKKAYFLILLEKSGKIQLPIYSLIQLLNSINKVSNKISSSEGWRKENKNDSKQGEKLIEKERARLEIAKTRFENEKKEEALLKKSYIVISVTAIVLITFFIIIPSFKSVRENKFWLGIKIENTIASYDKYLNRYPEGKHLNEALEEKRKILEMEEKTIWDKIIEKNTKRGYQQYLNRIKKIKKYEKEAKEKIDIIDWDIALEKNSIVGYKKYMRQHNSIDGKYYSKAMDEMEVLQKTDKMIKDEKQWKEVTNINSKNAYETYLSSNPDGKYVMLANEKILKFKKKEIKFDYRENIDYSEKIRMYILAEDNRDFDEIYSYYSSNLKRYWQTKYPTYSKLKKQYENAWKSTSYSKNYIDKIVRINYKTYDLYTKYEFYRIKLGKTFIVNSQIRFIFDNNAKISEVYKLNI